MTHAVTREFIEDFDNKSMADKIKVMEALRSGVLPASIEEEAHGRFEALQMRQACVITEESAFYETLYKYLPRAVIDKAEAAYQDYILLCESESKEEALRGALYGHILEFLQKNRCT